MKRIIIIIIFCIFGQFNCISQIPHLSGIIEICTDDGIIECDLEVSNLPKIDGYSILLNAGFNINYFRDSTDSYNYYFNRYYDYSVSYEAFQYYFPSNSNTRFLPKSFKINYIGAFPVIKDTARMSNGGDWKGNIAFNGEYLRATEQSAWYPILYDTLNDVLYDKATYNIKVIGKDGESVYINGSPPVKIQKHETNIESKKPVQLMIFVGNYSFSENNKTWFINTSLTNSQKTALSLWTNKIIRFYEEKLKIPYGYPVSFLNARPVSKSQSWMFVTYPTIAVIGHPLYSINSIFHDNSQELKDSSIINYYSHELGHYYFGTYFVPNAELKWMFLEGVTEYVSLQVSREILGERYYKESINNYIEKIKNLDFLPLNQVKQKSDIDEVYRYNYIPLLLTVLEKEIGKEKIWKWLNVVLKSKNEKTNYTFFKSTLIESGLSQNEFKNFENEYIESSNSKNNIINKVEKK